MRSTILIKANGEQTVVTPKNGKKFTYEELYELMNCDIVERHTLSDGRTMIMDENGRFKKPLRTNKTATRMFRDGRIFKSSDDLFEFGMRHFPDEMKMFGKNKEQFIKEQDSATTIYGDVVICEPEMFA